MNKQIAALFDRFYNIALKDKIQDPLLHSEWNYFQSMLSGNTFERDRINMYLSILENQRKKKEKVFEFEFNSLNYQPKIEKRFSEPVRNDMLHQTQGLRCRQDNTNEIAKSPKLMTPKTKYTIKRVAIADCKENNPTGSGTKLKQNFEKPDYRRLCEIANNLARVFQVSSFD